MQDNSDLIIRDCCEAEVAEFGQPDTICITVDVLREIVQRHSPGPCLHQIQEPAPVQLAQPAMTAALFAARGALQHLREGGKPTESLLNEAIAAIDSVATSEAAPAAVAVPDAVREAEKLLRAEAARLKRIFGLGTWYGFSAEKASHIEHLRVADALAATPAAEPDMVSVKKVDANNYCRILAALGVEEEGDPVAEVQRLLSTAAAPVVLPEPFALYDGKKWYANEEAAICSCADMEKLQKVYLEPQLRALLATDTGLPAQAVEQAPVLYVSKGQLDNHRDPDGPESFNAGLYLPARITPAGKFTTPLFAAPQAQADARDADDAELIKWLSDQYLAADFQWGDPKTPVLVIEIPPTASVCGDFRTDVRAAIAAAKGE